MMATFKKALIAFIMTVTCNCALAMEIAISVDDLPATGAKPDNVTRKAIADKMLAVFAKHNIKGVYGLIHGNDDKSEVGSILESWIDAGHYLGNHTVNHFDLAQTESSQFISDIRGNEEILAQLMRGNDYRYFRYPYLSEGNTQEKRDSVRNYLFANGYKIAPVTVDFFEYEYNEPYVRCSKNNDASSIKWLKDSFIEQASNALIIAHELSTMMFSRDIKYVSLIHINAFDAEMLDELLASYEKQGVKFISLQEAVNDPAYQINPNVIADRAYTFLNQVRLARGLANPDIVKKLYDSFPEERLNDICRN